MEQIPSVEQTTPAAATPPRRARTRKTPPGPLTVTQPTGSTFEVPNAHEKSFYEAQMRKYLAEFKFTASADLADLDRLLFQELLDFRWTKQLGNGKDYDGQWLSAAIEDAYRRNKIAAATVISQIKTDLGMNRASRDAQLDSPADFIRQLLIRAKEHGVHRNNQVIAALRLFNHLKSIVGTFDRSNMLERDKVGIRSEEDIVAWIRDVAIPEFDAIDDAWRSSTQKYWDGETV